MIENFCTWLAATALSRTLAPLEWLVPIVQTVHILGIAVTLTALVMLDFRLLGWARRGPPTQEFSARILPALWVALLVLLMTGALLTVIEPKRELLSNVFRVKMLLVVALAASSVTMGRTLARDGSGSTWLKPVAAINLVLLVAIVAAGRFIAYV